MKFEVKKVFVFLPLIAALAACGGGGSDGESVNTNQGTTGGASTGGSTGGATGGSASGSTPLKETPAGSSGSVSAPFAVTPTSRYLLVGLGVNDYALVQTGVAQQADGAVVGIDDKTLTGDVAVQSISGDATFAMGRWAQGFSTARAAGTQITRSEPGFHYIAFNRATFPSTGNYDCDAGTFTAPTRTMGLGDIIGTAIGTGSVSFSPSGATMKATILVRANGDQSSTTASNTFPLSSPDSAVKTANFSMLGDGMLLALGAAQGNRVRLVVGYQVSVKNADYRGIATFTCAP